MGAEPQWASGGDPALLKKFGVTNAGLSGGNFCPALALNFDHLNLASEAVEAVPLVSALHDASLNHLSVGDLNFRVLTVGGESCGFAVEGKDVSHGVVV